MRTDVGENFKTSMNETMAITKSVENKDASLFQFHNRG